jgi:hypothetical protein
MRRRPRYAGDTPTTTTRPHALGLQTAYIERPAEFGADARDVSPCPANTGMPATSALADQLLMDSARADRLQQAVWRTQPVLEEAGAGLK